MSSHGTNAKIGINRGQSKPCFRSFEFEILKSKGRTGMKRRFDAAHHPVGGGQYPTVKFCPRQCLLRSGARKILK